MAVKDYSTIESVKVVDGKLIVTLTLVKPYRTPKGNLVIATTGGNQESPVTYKGHRVKIGMTAYVQE